jgi:CheY-like chemotaxis protein
VGAARSLLGLLNDILDFSKVEAGKMQLNPEPFQLERLLGDLSVILSSNLGAKTVDLLFDVDPAIPRELVGDAMRLKQILINLGGNAVKFTEKGEVVIRWTLLARTPERVRIAIAVEDTGIGIAPENQSRIFDAFTQAEANTTRRFGGTGLGLVISTRLIRLMGGELQLSSVLGQGSIFSFALELSVADFGRPQPPPQPVLDAPEVRVLLVDDNPRALATSAAMMRTLGWTVTEAASGPQALDVLRDSLAAGNDGIDALFVDAEMPDMDGLETLHNVRRLYGPHKPPLLILLSRQSRDALAQRSAGAQEQISALMVKPLTAAMFGAALAQAREGSSALDNRQQAQVRRLAGMRLLLVEDNPINQQVAQELLSAEGASVTLADNGALGLEALRQYGAAFDAVLMDLQMPVMDGIKATRLLRADARFATLPVIAMTANAMLSDREECLAAGMNDHIGKPFDLQQLVQTLITHTGWAVQKSLPFPVLPTAAPAGAGWPDGIEVELALSRLGGSKDLLQRAISAFVADARLLPQRLEQGLRDSDRAQVRRELHAFKGLSATIGAPGLSKMAEEAEKLAQEVSAAEAFQRALLQFQSGLLSLLPRLEEVAKRLQAEAESDTATIQPPLLDQTVRGQLNVLLRALQASDMEAMALHAQLRQSAEGSLVDTMAPLDAAMAELDFERAALACEKLARQFDTT